MNLRKIPSIIFYVLAALLMFYAVWAFMRSADIISDAIEAGQITISGNLYEIISFYMANTGRYFVYAILLAGVGLLLYKNHSSNAQVINEVAKEAAEKAVKEAVIIQNDAELDEWFNRDAESSSATKAERPGENKED